MSTLDKEIYKDATLLHRPTPGHWYVNGVGQLQQVRMILYKGRRQCQIMLESINGKREAVDLAGWWRLDLMLHTLGPERRRRRRSRDTTEKSV